MKLSDAVIAHIAKLIQLGILTGTDVVDHMRMLRLTIGSEEDVLSLDPAYEKIAEQNIEKMLNNIENVEYQA